MSEWAMEQPQGWIEFVNAPDIEEELDNLRCSAQRGRPFESETWVIRIAKQLGLQSTLNSRGRPKAVMKTLPTLFSYPLYFSRQAGRGLFLHARSTAVVYQRDLPKVVKTDKRTKR
jgi:hypothetical protein